MEPESCQCGKVRYYTRKEARNVASAMKGRGATPGRGRKLRPYKCPSGPFWHLTSNPTSSVTYYRERGLS